LISRIDAFAPSAAHSGRKVTARAFSASRPSTSAAAASAQVKLLVPDAIGSATSAPPPAA
jgi:hypothetical protein